MRGSGGGEMLEMLSESSKGSGQPNCFRNSETHVIHGPHFRDSILDPGPLVLLKNSLRGSSAKQGWRMIAAGLGNQRN